MNKKVLWSLVGGVLVIMVAIGTYQVTSNRLSKTEFEKIITQSMAYVNEAKTLKEDAIAGKIEAETYETRSIEIEQKAAELNETIRKSNLSSDIKIEKEVVENAGNAVESVIAIIFQSKDLKDLQDEILAINIILEDMKNGVVDE